MPIIIIIIITIIIIIIIIIRFVKPKKGECHSCKGETWKLNCCHDNS